MPWKQARARRMFILGVSTVIDSTLLVVGTLFQSRFHLHCALGPRLIIIALHLVRSFAALSHLSLLPCPLLPGLFSCAWFVGEGPT